MQVLIMLSLVFLCFTIIPLIVFWLCVIGFMCTKVFKTYPSCKIALVPTKTLNQQHLVGIDTEPVISHIIQNVQKIQKKVVYISLK